MKKELRSIWTMHVMCMLKVRNLNSPATAASDCCQTHAMSGVLTPSGAVMWRCHSHQGIVSVDEAGNIVDLGHVVSDIATLRKD